MVAGPGDAPGRRSRPWSGCSTRSTAASRGAVLTGPGTARTGLAGRRTAGRPLRAPTGRRRSTRRAPPSGQPRGAGARRAGGRPLRRLRPGDASARRVVPGRRHRRLITSKPVDGQSLLCRHSIPREPPLAAPATTKHIFVTGGVASSLGKGLTASRLGHLLRVPRSAGHHAEARPLPQRRPRDDEPVPARRGLRHRRRGRDRPRRRPLRAVPRQRPARLGQRHDRAGLLDGDRQGAPRRVPRRHRAGDPAHHQRDQGPHPRDGRPRRRRRHHRGRRHRRRHRVAAVPRGGPPGAPRRRPRQRASSCTSRWCPTSGRPAS